jgi:hypothetical protein
MSALPLTSWSSFTWKLGAGGKRDGRARLVTGVAQQRPRAGCCGQSPGQRGAGQARGRAASVPSSGLHAGGIAHPGEVARGDGRVHVDEDEHGEGVWGAHGVFGGQGCGLGQSCPAAAPMHTAAGSPTAGPKCDQSSPKTVTHTPAGRHATPRSVSGVFVRCGRPRRGGPAVRTHHGRLRGRQQASGNNFAAASPAPPPPHLRVPDVRGHERHLARRHPQPAGHALGVGLGAERPALDAGHQQAHLRCGGRWGCGGPLVGPTAFAPIPIDCRPRKQTPAVRGLTACFGRCHLLFKVHPTHQQGGGAARNPQRPVEGLGGGVGRRGERGSGVGGRKERLSRDLGAAPLPKHFPRVAPCRPNTPSGPSAHRSERPRAAGHELPRDEDAQP